MKGITPILLILLSVGVFFFFIDPQYKQVQALQAEKSENDIAIQKAEQLRTERGVLNQKYNNISEDERKTLSQILPDTVDNVRLILDINNIADNYGIVLRSINVSGGPLDEESQVNRTTSTRSESSRFGTIQLSFSFTADYDTFKSFMKDLEGSLRLVDITNFSVTTGEENLYSYSLSLNTYWLR